ncbi:MAG: molybdopterin-synthase adenylyltransferase MoeB [Burkholderiaceae bacterium]|nr:MAG: molybdopterin-synthase adenylyltransferase MoeB [Burkholderiaceae bacterium]
MNDDSLLRYSRHLLLDGWGVEAQQRITAAHVLIIGAGGLGCPAAQYLAAAGVGTLTLVDDDNVDLTNLQRQILHTTARIGQAKVNSAAAALTELNPEIQIHALAQRASGEALDALVAQADVVLDCSDNFATRHAVNRACVAARTPLVSGAAIRWEGQLAVFDLRRSDSPCYHCLFPEGASVEELRCATTGVFAPLTGIIGTLQAAEALKLLAGLDTVSRLQLFDARSHQWRSIGFTRDPQCAVCSTRAGD